jgi:Domain of unknown function (DUF4303)
VDVAALKAWVSEPRLALAAAVAEGIRVHVDRLRSLGTEFYGYAIHPGEPHDIRRLVAVTNCEADIKVPAHHAQYAYYRYCVDEWTNWEHGDFQEANAVLGRLNEQHAARLANCEQDSSTDRLKRAYTGGLLEAVLGGFRTALANDVFGDADPFLAIWFSDSNHLIMSESVRLLNSAEVAGEFMAEFG